MFLFYKEPYNILIWGLGLGVFRILVHYFQKCEQSFETSNIAGDCRVWITPARSPDCEFGDATAMFKSLQLNPNAAVFQIPSSGTKKIKRFDIKTMLIPKIQILC